MPLAKYHDMVKAFPSDRPDQPLTIAILPWRPRRSRPIPNTHRTKAPDEDLAINAIIIYPLAKPRAARQPIKGNKATANQSPLLRLCRVSFQKNVYASAIGLCKDSIIMQSTKPSNSDLYGAFAVNLFFDAAPPLI